ncbi:hypothetical protein ACFPYJ_10375 [Paenibacillus solisilvae]|uniref:Uncharacterized protein n=1 Tax=Paenibacillus solisilvae TaxID=2486751 RepID=A0ABW0VX10_9BACL
MSKDADMAALLTLAIKDYVQMNMAQFITGSKDLDKDWEQYVKGFDGLNVNKYLDIYQRAIDKKT